MTAVASNHRTHLMGTDNVCERCGITLAMLTASDPMPACERDTPSRRGLSFRQWLTARRLERQFDKQRYLDGGRTLPREIPEEGWPW